MNFKAVINTIESKVGEEITRQLWKAKLLSVFDKRAHSIKVLVRFSKDDFFFDDEIKLVEQHFNEDTKYGAEIVRRLNRLNNYTKGIENLKGNIGDIPNITNRWKAYLSNLIEVSPTQCQLTITYIRNVANEIMSFDKVVTLTASSFISLETINRSISDNLDKLNEPINITYYQNLI